MRARRQAKRGNQTWNETKSAASWCSWRRPWATSATSRVARSSSFDDADVDLLRGHAPLARALQRERDRDRSADFESLHEHNEASQSEEIVARVRAGELVVLISDAGTPGISDPGARAVAAVVAAGLRVTTAPGPSAVVAALSISGLSTERFVMEGFLPRKAGEREQRYGEWAHEARTIVFYESPAASGASVCANSRERYPDRRVAVARELTKVHEEVLRGTVAEVASTLRRARRRWARSWSCSRERAPKRRVEDDVVLRGAAASSGTTGRRRATPSTTWPRRSGVAVATSTSSRWTPERTSDITILTSVSHGPLLPDDAHLLRQ